MLAEMAHIKSKRPFGVTSELTTQAHKEVVVVSEDKYHEVRRPRKIVFFCNGNRYFKGKKLFITPHRYLSFNDLLTDLTGKLPTSSSLPYGVRQIYTPSGGHRIREIEELQDGKAYVCAGFETFKTIKYGDVEMEPWATGRTQKQTELPHLDVKFNGSSLSGYSSSGFSGAFAKSTNSQGNIHKQHPDAYAALRLSEDKLHQMAASSLNKPTVVTVVRAGMKPYSSMKILLNRTSVQSYEALLTDISETFGPKWKHNRVRRLYALSGREVLSLSDFFRGDNVFVAVGNEKATLADIQDIIEEMFQESPHAKTLLRSVVRRKKKARHENLVSLREEDQKSVLQAVEDDAHVTAAPTERGDGLDKANVMPDADRAMDQNAAAPGDNSQDKSRHQKPRLKVKPSPREAAAAMMAKAKEPDKFPEKPPPLPDVQLEASKRHNEADVALIGGNASSLEGAAQQAKAHQQQEKRSDEERQRQSLYRGLEAKLKVELQKIAADDGEGGKTLAELPTGEEAVKQKLKVMEKKPKLRLAKTKADRQTTAERLLQDYEIGRTLGDGNFALVKACVNRKTGIEYAMKVIDKSKLKGKEAMLENEVTIMKACNDPNLVKLIDEFETEDEIFLVLELIKGGDLFDAITHSVKFDEAVAAGMTRDITLALFYMHSRNIVHRDLKPENVMVMRSTSGGISLKLGDFGLAVEVLQTLFTICGTPTYVAPEILSEVGYGLEIDMWAVGVITYILLCGFPPFRSPDRDQTELFEFIKAGQYEFLSPYWDAVSSDAKDLIERLLVVDKKRRYTAIDVLCHPWILSGGNTVPLPRNLELHRENVRNELLSRAADNMAEWKANHEKIFAHMQ